MKRTLFWLAICPLLFHTAATWGATDTPSSTAGQVRAVDRNLIGHAKPAVRPNVLPLSDSDPDDIYWDNSISSSLPGVDVAVKAVVVYNGKLVAAGNFSVAGQTAAMRIAAWDGSSWSALGAGVAPGEVNALAVYDNKLIVAGTFNTADGVSANGIAAWDGTSWSALGAGVAPGVVNALAVYDNKLIAAGAFLTDLGAPANGIAAWDGDAWSALGTGMRSQVSALTVYGDQLIAGGYFRTAGGVDADYIASWDGTSWSPLGTGISWAVRALTVYDNMLIAGGAFETAGGVVANRIAAWNGSTWSSLGTGMDPTNPRDGGGISVRALAAYDNKLIAGGVFTTAGDVPASHVAAWDGTSWSALGTGIGLGWVDALAIYDNKLIAGGRFNDAGGTVAIGIAAWDASAWSALGIAQGMNGPVSTLSAYDDELIAAGEFTVAGQAHANKLAAWDGSAWSPLGTGIAPGEVGLGEPQGVQVSALTRYRDRLIVGGNFHEAGGTAAYAIAAWDGNSWSSLGSGLRYPPFDDASVNALTVYDNKLIAGGRFNTAGGVPANNIAAWDGTSWSALGMLGSVNVLVLTVHDNQLIAGGFRYAGRQHDPFVAAWDGTSWSSLESGFEGPGSVGELTVYNHSLVAAGYFAIAGDPAASHIAAWDGTSWSSLGTGANWGGNGVTALTVYDNKLIAAGLANIASWDGTSWSRLGSGLGAVRSPFFAWANAMVQYRGRLVTGGNFALAGGKLALHLAEWTKRADIDVALDIRPGSCPNPVNGNRADDKGKGMLPVAILGASDLDVHDIDPTSVTLNGLAPVRWSYRDVGTPADRLDNDCVCSDQSPDGNDDLSLKFYSADIVATLSAPDATSPAGGPHRDSHVLRVEGLLRDGSTFSGSDCVVLVGEHAMNGVSEADVEDHDQNGVSEAGPARRFELRGNYPNPFNPQTTISFYLPSASHVRLDVFDVLGRRVVTLIERSLEAGVHSVTWDSSQAASGVYYYRLQAGAQRAQGRMLLLK